MAGFFNRLILKKEITPLFILSTTSTTTLLRHNNIFFLETHDSRQSPLTLYVYEKMKVIKSDRSGSLV